MNEDKKYYDIALHALYAYKHLENIVLTFIYSAHSYVDSYTFF